MESAHCDRAGAASHELAVEDSWDQWIWFSGEQRRTSKSSETFIEQNSRYGCDLLDAEGRLV